MLHSFQQEAATEKDELWLSRTCMHMHSSEMHCKKACDVNEKQLQSYIMLVKTANVYLKSWNKDKYKDFYTSVWTKMHFNHIIVFWFWLVGIVIILSVKHGCWWACLGVKSSFPVFQGPALLAFPKLISCIAIASYSNHKRVWIIKEATLFSTPPLLSAFCSPSSLWKHPC